MQITISGGTGFIGRALARRLLADNHSVHVLGRSQRGLEPGARFFFWDAGKSEPPADSLAGADAFVYLAGEPVAQRWTEEVKKRIRSSRVDGTRQVIEALSAMSHRPSAFVCASAVGIYGSRGDEVLTEASPPGRGFLAEVCVDWERTAALGEALGMRVVRVRIGVVLEREGGALARMLPPFRMGAGGRLGSGTQWMSWIHLEDLRDLIRFAILSERLSGPVNAAAPNPVRNADFTKELAAALHRPALFPVPSFALKAMFGEMAGVLLESQRVLPQAAQSAGFEFRYPELGPALRQLLA